MTSDQSHLPSTLERICIKSYHMKISIFINILSTTRNWLQARLTVYPPQCAAQNPVNLSIFFFFNIELLHAHLQYVCNIPSIH